MKFASFTILIGISLCASICCPGEDDYVFNNTIIKNDTIIQIENNSTNFQVDDMIYISTVLENEQVSTNASTVYLTDFVSDSPDSFYYYYINLYKETAYGTYALIELNENALEIIDGETFIDYQSLIVRCDLDSSVFRNKFGIKLLEPGTYYLSGSLNYNTEVAEIIQISTSYSGNQGITIYSKIMNSGDDGRYYFTVN